MSGAVVALTAAYVAVAALLLHLNLRTPYAVAIKVAAVVAVTSLYAFAWHGSLGLLGWPADANLPDAFRLEASVIDEPPRGAPDEGGIYLWVRALDEQGNPVGRPRAHGLPWDPDFAERVQGAKEELADGARLNGFASEGGEVGETELDVQGQGGSETTGVSVVRPFGQGFPFEIRRATRPELPPKGLPDP